MKKIFLISAYLCFIVLITIGLISLADFEFFDNSSKGAIVQKEKDSTDDVEEYLEDFSIDNQMYLENQKENEEITSELDEKMENTDSKIDDVMSDVDLENYLYNSPQDKPNDELQEIAQQNIDGYIENLYVLQETYVQSLNEIIEQTKTEFKNYPLDEQTSKNKQDLVSSKTSLLEELEDRCDENFNEIIALIEIELEILGEDNSLILDAKSEYRKAKATLKAKYLDEFTA
ncbi:MAG: hypothetical protein R3Y09_06885 [Clostridia bacterium]